MSSIRDIRDAVMEMPAIFQSAAIAAGQAGVLIVVTSAGAIALRLYSLAYRMRRRGPC